jgi:macrolide-specific efflux system membrane fusion protein
VKTVTLLAGSAGVLSSFPVIVGQVVSVGETVGQVAPPSFSVSGALPAEQQYRLLNRPTEALVSITGGPAAFTCTGLVISTKLPGAGSSDTTSDSSGNAASTTAAGTTVRCAVPASVTVFPGLAAKLTISGGVAKDVLVVPTTAVEGTTQNGVVYTAQPNGSSTKVPVTLGLTDGKNVQILTGVKSGDKILQFIPGAVSANPTDGACSSGNGTMVCQGAGG